MTIAHYAGRNAVGTSTERGAATWTGAPAGYRFLETDTLKTYVWSGSAWAEQVISGAGGSASEGSITRTTRTAQYVTMPSAKKRGTYYAVNSSNSGDGLWANNIATAAGGTGTTGTKTIDSTDGVYMVYSTGATQNSISGFRTTTYTEMSLNPYLKFCFRVNSISNIRIAIMLGNFTATPTTTADPLATKSGVALWFDSAVNANWRIFTNNGGASSHNTDTTVPAATGLWIVEFQFDTATPQIKWAISSGGGGAYTNETNTPPGAGTDLAFAPYIENTTASTQTINFLYGETEVDK